MRTFIGFTESNHQITTTLTKIHKHIIPRLVQSINSLSQNRRVSSSNSRCFHFEKKEKQKSKIHMHSHSHTCIHMAV